MSDEKTVISKIADLAAKASAEVLAKFPALKDAAPMERGMAITRITDTGAIASLATAIRDENLFGDLRVGWIEHGNGGQAIQTHMLPQILIDAAIQGRSVETLISDAIALAASKSSAEIWFMPIAGIKLVEKAVLADDLDLIPWSEVPVSPQKTKFGNTPQMMSDFAQFTATPTAAIVKRIAPRQVLFSAPISPMDPKFEEMTSRTEETNDIIRCITALAVRSVAALGGWSQLTNAYANWLVGVSYYWGEALFDTGISMAPDELHPEAVSELFKKFKRVRASERDVLRIALDRLNQALRERRIVDKAIDQGIALETLLLHGIDKDSRGELRYRQSIRGATFLGGGKEDRRKIFDTLRSAYDLRSAAVHTGSLGKKDAEAVAVMNDAARICASIARKVIDRGSFPNWEIEFVLDGT